MSKKLGLIHSNNTAYATMNQCHSQFKKGHSNEFKVNASILRYLYISQTLRSGRDHSNHLRTHAALMAHKMISDGMWLDEFNYINLHGFALYNFLFN